LRVGRFAGIRVGEAQNPGPGGHFLDDSDAEVDWCLFGDEACMHQDAADSQFAAVVGLTCCDICLDLDVGFSRADKFAGLAHG